MLKQYVHGKFTFQASPFCEKFPLTVYLLIPHFTRCRPHLGKAPVLGSASEVPVRPCESVVNGPLPCESYGSFKLFTISASDFDTVSVRRRFRTCAYEFLTTVTEGVVHGVHKIVNWSSFGVIQRHKVS